MNSHIKWHEACLKNRKKHAVELQNDINTKMIRLKQLIKDNELLERQINRAISEGKDRFDSSIYCIPRQK